MMSGLYSTGYYLSMVSPAISQSYAENLVELKMVSRFTGPDSRTALEALGSVRYVVALNPLSNVPYGYEQIAEETGKNTGKEYTVYENKNPLPLGYTYSNLITREKFDSLEPANRQEAMLQGVVLDGYDNSLGLDDAGITLTGEKVKYTVTDMKGVLMDQDGSFVAVQKNASVSLAVRTTKNSETYFGLKNLRFTGISEYEALHFTGQWDSKSPEEQRSIRKANRYYIEPEAQMIPLKTLGGKGISLRIFNFVTRKYQRYNGRTDFFINTGYSEKSKTTITVTASNKKKATCVVTVTPVAMTDFTFEGISSKKTCSRMLIFIRSDLPPAM